MAIKYEKSFTYFGMLRKNSIFMFLRELSNAWDIAAAIGSRRHPLSNMQQQQ